MPSSDPPKRHLHRVRQKKRLSVTSDLLRPSQETPSLQTQQTKGGYFYQPINMTKDNNNIHDIDRGTAWTAAGAALLSLRFFTTSVTSPRIAFKFPFSSCSQAIDSASLEEAHIKKKRVTVVLTESKRVKN